MLFIYDAKALCLIKIRCKVSTFFRNTQAQKDVLGHKSTYKYG